MRLFSELDYDMELLNGNTFINFVNTMSFKNHCWDKTKSGRRNLMNNHVLIWNTGEYSNELTVWIERTK